METITRTYEAYEFSELSKEAKEIAKQWLLNNDMKTIFFSEDCNSILECDFPNSDLKVEYSLSYCQGDGLNIYGKVSFIDMLDNLKLTDKEKRKLEFYAPYYPELEMRHNQRYGYSCKFLDKQDAEYNADEWKDFLQHDEIANIDYDFILKVINETLDYFENKDYEMEQDGYKYFYELTDEEAQEECDANEWLFFEDGKFFNL